MWKSYVKNCVHLSFGFLILAINTDLQAKGMHQRDYEFDGAYLNEITDDTVVDNDAEFSRLSSLEETNFTTFLLMHSKKHFADKTTREGLDITSPQMFQSKTIAQLYAVFPGTNWCGIGNLATNDQVLGFFATTDSCCRAHDNCRLTISPGTKRFGLRNTGYFTRSHCWCDERFYYCLKRAKSIIAEKVGITYFNILKPQCFRKDYPIVACLRWYKKRCLTYVVDQSDGREWQWFDNREY